MFFYYLKKSRALRSRFMRQSCRSLLLYGLVACNLSVVAQDNGNHIYSSSALWRAKKDGMSLTFEFLQEMERIFETDTFIETGTGYGDTTHEAQAIFKNVYTIEISPSLYEISAKRFENNKNVKCLLGESSALLPELLNGIQNTILFWLDGHNSPMVDMNLAETNSPLLNELRAIKASGRKHDIILIDDIRCSLWVERDWAYIASKYPPDTLAWWNAVGKGWPRFPEILKAVKEINPDYQIILLNDVLLAFPSTEIQIDQTLKAFIRSLAAEFTSNDLEELITLDQEIAAIDIYAINSLKDTIAWLGVDRTPWYMPYQYFWYGLTLLKNGAYELAEKYLRLAERGGFFDCRPDSSTAKTCSRVNWYLAQALLQQGKVVPAVEALVKVPLRDKGVLAMRTSKTQD